MTTVLISGYFSPIIPGHIDLINEASKLGDRLVLILNNDMQADYAGVPLFMKEKERLAVVAGLRRIHEIVLSVDTDESIIETLKFVVGMNYGEDFILANGGGARNIKEEEFCECHPRIASVYGVGDVTEGRKFIDQKVAAWHKSCDELKRFKDKLEDF